MAEAHNSSEQPDDGGRTRLSDTGDIDELRRLLIGPERDRLDRLQERVDNPRLQPRHVFWVLAEAVHMRTGEDGELGEALAPTIEDSLRTSVKKDPQGLVDAIFPVLLPAIRKAISDILERMLQALNQALEHSFSPRSLKWRWQAWRTGQPFASVVLLKTLLYRVEQVFLIHRDSGLLLQHVVAEGIAQDDSDMISSMLTAIRDFVRDSFGPRQGETLDALQIGERRVWIASNSQAVLAAVIQGTAPLSLRDDLSRALEKIHREYEPQLSSFDGDAAPFEATQPNLENCLKQARRPPGKPVLASVVVAVPLILVAVWSILAFRQHHLAESFEAQLAETPGFVVQPMHKRGGKYVISGLKDPLSEDPVAVLEELGLDRTKFEFEWEEYHSTEKAFVRTRALAALNLPTGVDLEVENGVLHLSGEALAEWVARARQLVFTIPGVTGLQDAGLVVTDGEQQERHRVLQQARSILHPPSSVKLDWRNGTLVASGSATHGWIVDARLLARVVPGVQTYSDEQVADEDLADIVLERATIALRPPRTVDMQIRDGILVFAGSALQRWIEEVHRLGPLVPGVEAVDTDAVAVFDAERLVELQSQIRNAVLYFRLGAVELLPHQEASMETLARNVSDLADIAAALSWPLEIRVIGHSDHTGLRGVELGRERAAVVMGLLIDRGIAPRLLSAHANDAPALPSGQNRRVTLGVSLREP